MVFEDLVIEDRSATIRRDGSLVNFAYAVRRRLFPVLQRPRHLVV